MFRLKVALCCLALCCAVSAEASTSRAFDFAYGVNQKVPSLQILTGVQTPGTTRVVLALGNIAVNGITIAPLATNTPLLVGTGGNAETVTPTAVNCPNPSIYQTCAFTATFTKSHVIGETVSSGSVGLAEAVNYEHKISGVVTIDGDWSAAGGANGTITSLLGWLNVTVYDARGTANAAALNWQVAGDGQAYQNIVISGGGTNTYNSASGLSLGGSAVSCLPSGASQNGCLQSSDFTNFQAIYTALNTLAFSGNTKTAVTTNGARTAGNCPTWDASGNLINSAYTLPGCGASGGLSTFLGLSQSATPATEGQIPFVASGVWTGLTATPLVTAGAYGFHIDGSGNGYPYKLCRQVSGTSDTVTQADGGKCVNYTNATGVTVAYPAPTSSLYPALPITLIQVGGGTLTLTSVANFAGTGAATNLTNLLTAGSTPQTPKSVEVLNDATVLWLDNYNNGAGVASSVAVANVTSGTSNNAWVIGTGGSIAPSGSGTIQATSVTSAAGVPQINLAASGAGGVGGNLPPTNLDNGTNANSSTVWCGNGHWCTPPAGFSNPMSTIGDLIVGSTAGAPVRLGAGAVGTALLGNGAGVAPTWGAFLANPMTTAGDIIYGGVAGAPTRLTAGTNGYQLTANGAGVAPSYQGFTATATGAVTRPSASHDNDLRTLKDFGCIGDGVTNDSACIQAAVNTGQTVIAPAGSYRINTTVSMATAGAVLMGLGQNATYFLKGANVALFAIQCGNCGIERAQLVGTFTSPTVSTSIRTANWPVSVITGFTDTTSGIVIGTANSIEPGYWILDNLNIFNMGLDGIDYEDGPSGYADHIVVGWNGQWGWFGTNITFMGGTGEDPSHGDFLHLQGFYNGSGSFTTGGNISFGGQAHGLNYLKSFNSYGSGIVVSATSSKLNNIFSELDAQMNVFNGSSNTTGLNAWVTSTAYTTGAMVINASKVYQATTTATSGASAPTCTSGTCSDGTVTWQFRASSEIAVTQTTGYNTNDLHIAYQSSGLGPTFQSGVSSSAPIGGITDWDMGLYSAYPQKTIVDSFMGSGAFISADTLGGNNPGCVGYGAEAVSGGTRRAWFCVDQPNGNNEVYIGSPDNLFLGFHSNGALRAEMNSGGGFLSPGFDLYSTDLSSTDYIKQTAGDSNGNPALELASNVALEFSASGQAFGSPDVGFHRTSTAGLVEVSNGNGDNAGGSLALTALVSGGTSPTTTGSTCGTIGTQTGGNTGGTIVTAAVTACTLKLNFAFTAPHGWNCWFSDMTSVPATLTAQMRKASSNTTSCTSNAATITAADVIQFNAFPY